MHPSDGYLQVIFCIEQLQIFFLLRKFGNVLTRQRNRHSMSTAGWSAVTLLYNPTNSHVPRYITQETLYMTYTLRSPRLITIHHNTCALTHISFSSHSSVGKIFFVLLMYIHSKSFIHVTLANGAVQRICNYCVTV